jgi:hypothetical protein
MKKKLNLWIASMVLMSIIFIGCSRNEEVKPANTEGTATEMSAPEIEVLATVADDAFINMEANGGTETEGFSLENDGLPDAYQVTESTADEIAKRDGNARRLKACLSKLELSSEQVAKLRRTFKAYDECKSSIIKRHSAALRELLAKFNARHDELVKALRNGRITKQQFEEKMKALRVEFHRAKAHLAEKARTALKSCYTHMLRSMHSILTERQWKAFVNCYR